MRMLLAIPIMLLAAVPFASGQSHPNADADPERPEGTIAFASLAPHGWDLYLSATEPSRESRLTDHPALDFNAAFAPDGGRIAFVSTRDGNLEIYTIGADGSGPRRLTREFALDDHPAW